MAKRNKQINRDAEAEASRINRESSNYYDMLSGRMPRAQQRGSDIYGDLYEGYNKFLGDDYGSGGPDFGQYEGMFKKLYDTGGLDAENINRIRGGGNYDEFARTGGLSEEDKGQLRKIGNRTIPSYFDALRAKMSDQAAISGAPASYSASIQAMARDQSRGAQEAAENVESDIINKVLQGRMFGTEGMSKAELGLGDILSRTKLASAEGGLKAAGMGGEFALGRDKNRLAALAGLGDLRTSVPGEEFALYDLILKNMGQRGNLYGGNLGQRMQYNPNKGFMDYFTEIAKIVGPIAATALTGGAAAPSLALMGTGGSSKGFTPTPYTPGGAASGEYFGV